MIKTLFGWAVFGSECESKSNINQISVNCLSISREEDLSEIIKVSDEDKLSQDDKNCVAHLDSITVYKK